MEAFIAGSSGVEDSSETQEGSHDTLMGALCTLLGVL